MKKHFVAKLPAMIFIIALSNGFSNDARAQIADSTNVTYQTFYDQLSPYGTWIEYPGYGHVWSPRVTGDFRPYATNGHWIFSDEGWTWASYYNWGWAPFHYGRWLYDDLYGWLWIPGYEWSPAWVTWGSVDNFYCWAPIMPGIDLSLQFGGWRPHSYYWNVCSRDHIYDQNLFSVMQRERWTTAMAHRIKIINNFNITNTHRLFYSKGPDVRDVERYIKHKIQPTSFRNVSRITEVRHDKNVMNVYRPLIKKPAQRTTGNDQQLMQPDVFRRADRAHSKPIMSEDQQPHALRSEQPVNLQRLPFHAPVARTFNRGGTHREFRNRIR